jgi:hypothetical protein
MIERVNRIEATAIMSPTEAALLNLIKSLINEIQVIDAEVSILSAGEGPTGCADDSEYELSDALKRISPERLNQLLNETLLEKREVQP